MTSVTAQTFLIVPTMSIMRKARGGVLETRRSRRRVVDREGRGRLKI